jgi:hypothetical protein
METHKLAEARLPLTTSILAACAYPDDVSFGPGCC